MFGARSFVLAASCAAACAISATLPVAAPAQSISLSLNVFYAMPSNVNSGGTWELIAKTGGPPAAGNFGIAGIEAHLKNIGAAVNEAPRATVNGNDVAGFNVFQDVAFPGYRNIIVAQTPILPLMAGEEQGGFYGVGQITNGSPNFAGKPTPNFTGPVINSLTLPLDIPWANVNDPFGDSTWNSAARLVSGTFAAGVTPAFFDTTNSGSVFITMPGTSATFGATNASGVTVSTFVRSNFLAGGADYNHNGIVDAADYIIWRNSNGQTVAAGTLGDGDGNGIVNQLDYNLWRSHFGLPSGAGSGGSLSTGVVPEPLSAVMLVLGAVLVLGFHRSVSRPATPRLQPAFVPARASGRSLAAIAKTGK